MLGLSLGLGIGTQQAVAGGGVAAATWATTNGINKNANLDLANANLSVSQHTYASTRNLIRAIRPVSPTAFEAEFTLQTGFSGFEIGIDDGTPDFSTQTSSPTASAVATALVWASPNFQTYKNGTWTGYTSSGVTPVAGNKITMIGDRTAGTLSFQLQGTLLNTVTGVSYANWNAFEGITNFSGVTDMIANFAGPFTYGANAAY